MVNAINRGVKSLGCWLGLLAAAAPAALAEPPGVYYSWRETEISVSQCISRAEAALEGEGLENILADDTSIAGQSEDITAVFICLESSPSTTVMIIVAGEDDTQVVDMREALKASF
jgi:hypothetical protein